MPDINAGKKNRFDDGSTMTMAFNGGAANTLINIIAGTWGFVPPVRATLDPDVDRGVLEPDIREGDEQPGSLAFDIKCTIDQGAAELYEMMTAASTNGYVPSFDIVVNIPDFPGAATGIRYSFFKAVRSEAPPINAGENYDTMSAKMIFTTMTKTAY